MKIIKLMAENIKRLVAVEITPDGNLVEITGKNAQGKTSVLDSIWWALAGASHIQAVPIRKGTNKARIKLDLGELIVTRVFNKGKAGGATTSITVEDADGKKMSSPQGILSGLIGELSFDPLAFSRMNGKEQLETLQRFVPGVNFEEIEKQNADDFTSRTEVNRRAKKARALADAISVPKDVPEKTLDESGLVDQLQKAGEHNADIEARKARREKAERDIEDKKGDAERLRGRAADTKQEAEKVMEAAKEKAGELAQAFEILETQAQTVDKEREALSKKLKAAKPLPEPIDAGDLRAQIEKARVTNAQVASAQEKAFHLKQVRALEEESTALTRSMENRDAKKRLSVEKAKMPVKEIALGDGEVFLNGVPFDQASDAERLRVSVSIAMASNPKLRVIRVRDGSLLDEDSMKMLAEMADTNDYQIWIERVDGNAKTGIILEDGMLKGAKVNV